MPSLTPVPEDAPFIETEVRVVEWATQDNGLTQEEHHRLFTEETLPDDDELLDRITPETRLGGTPLWVQCPEEAPTGDWQFAGQLDCNYWLHTAPLPQVAEEILGGVAEIDDSDNGHTHICPGPNFGDAGIGYVFLRPTEGTPEGWFFWQCY